MGDASKDVPRRLEPSRDVDESRERAKEQARGNAHPGRAARSAAKAESTRRWREAHPERVRELRRRWRAENLERSRELNRESMRRAAARKRQLAERRRRGNEASRRWKESHPEAVRAYHRAWSAANRDKVNEFYRRYRVGHREELNARATAWRDAHPEKMNSARKAWAARNKERLAETQRQRRRDPAKYRADLEVSAASKRLIRRLERAGLPPKRLSRATAAERRANDRLAEEYFADPVLPERLRQFTVLTVTLTEEVLAHGDRMLEFARSYVATRSRLGLPLVDAEQIMYARAAQVVVDRMKRVDLLTGREVAAAVRSAQASVAAALEARYLDQTTTEARAHLRRDRVRLDADADFENEARLRQGRPRLPTELLSVRIAIQEVLSGSAAPRPLGRSTPTIARRVEAAVVGCDRFKPVSGARTLGVAESNTLRR
jgi:hypothetical protein